MKKFLKPLCSALALALTLSACAVRQAPPVEINLVALNDFHGHLEAGKFTYTSMADKAERTIQAGGIDNLGATLQAWRAEDRELLFVGAGDLVGGTPAMSSMWADEPSIVALNMLGMNVSSVGNHEFDSGRIELLRKQHGGCDAVRPEKSCKLAPDFSGARFTYLAANVLDKQTGKPFLPAYRIEQAHGVKIGFIGAVLRDTPSVVLASGIVGLEFVDEAEAINRVLPELKAQGATVFVVLIHEGGTTQDYFDQPDCTRLKGPIVDVVRKLDPAIRLIVSGHSHKGYQCKVDGRVVTQAEMGGHVLSRIKLTVEPATHALRDIEVANTVVKPGLHPPHAATAAYLKAVRERSAAALARPVARLAVPSLSKTPNAAGEAVLGNLLADAVLAATAPHGAQIGIMNIGGIRKPLETGPGMTVSFAQAQVVLPFSNTLVLMTLTGAQIRALLEGQWMKEHDDERDVLQFSDGFTYRWDAQRPRGDRVVAGSIMLHGVPLADAASYRVAANNFLAEGGDNNPAFRAARDKVDSGIVDLDALTAFLAARARAGAPAGRAAPAGRIVRLN